MGRNRFLGQKATGAIFFSETAGAADVVNTETVTVGNKVFEFHSGAVTVGNIKVDITGAPSSDALADLFVTAFNANKPTVPCTAKKNPTTLDTATTAGVRIEADNPGAAGNITFTTTMATGTSAITGGLLLKGGENPGTQTFHRGAYVVDAVDVLLGGCVLPTGLQTIKTGQFEVQLASTTGLIKLWTDLVTVIDNNKLQVDIDGATPVVAGDTVKWNAWE